MFFPKFFKKSVVLVDLLLSVVILTTGLVVVVGGFFSLSDAISYSSHKIKSLNFLDNKINQLRGSSFLGGKIEDLPLSGDFVSDGKTFRWQLTLSDIAQLEGNGSSLKELKAAVFWVESSRAREQVVTTYIVAN